MTYNIPKGVGAFKVSFRYLVDQEKMSHREAYIAIKGEDKLNQLIEAVGAKETDKYLMRTIKDTKLNIVEARQILGLA